ncbi:MAG: hypothetical protein IFK91_02905 [Acidobacteria bacterium]|nr:hypothetical protein [Candidatus Sulfomarinibacter sp. MAG AM1]
MGTSLAADDGFFRTEARQFRGEYRDGQTPVCGALHKEGFMKRLAFLLLLIAVVSCGQQAATGPAPAQTAAESGEAVEAELLFVQEAEGVTFEGDTLTLIGVRPQVLFFTDRPQRVAGYLAFNVSIIEGLPPDAAGRSALFIDTIGRPMSPGSVAGVHRRHRRREVRRHTP